MSIFLAGILLRRIGDFVEANNLGVVPRAAEAARKQRSLRDARTRRCNAASLHWCREVLFGRAQVSPSLLN